jgi:AraC family transcriptional regulator
MNTSLFDLPLGRDAIVREGACSAVRRVSHADTTLAFESPDEVAIVVSLSSGHRVEGRFGGRWHSQMPDVGAVTVLPPSLPCRLTIAGQCRALMLRIPFSAVVAAAEEDGRNVNDLGVTPRLHASHDALKRLVIEAALAPSRQELPLLAIAHVLACDGGAPPGASVRGGLPPRNLRRVLDRVRDDLAGDLNLATLAEEAGMSTFHFARAFRESTGRSPHRFIVARRVARAIELLGDREHDVAEVARASGFAHASHLARAMRREIDLTPMQVRHSILV